MICSTPLRGAILLQGLALLSTAIFAGAALAEQAECFEERPAAAMPVVGEPVAAGPILAQSTATEPALTRRAIAKPMVARAPALKPAGRPVGATPLRAQPAGAGSAARKQVKQRLERAPAANNARGSVACMDTARTPVAPVYLAQGALLPRGGKSLSSLLAPASGTGSPAPGSGLSLAPHGGQIGAPSLSSAPSAVGRNSPTGAVSPPIAQVRAASPADPSLPALWAPPITKTGEPDPGAGSHLAPWFSTATDDIIQQPPTEAAPAPLILAEPPSHSVPAPGSLGLLAFGIAGLIVIFRYPHNAARRHPDA